MKQLAKILLLAFPAAAQPDRFGLPACPAPQAELADRAFFLGCYNSQLRVPLWTAHELKPAQIDGDAPRPRNFRHDHALTGVIARNADYRHSGFTRGHMVPAEDLAWSHESIRATFLLSNAVPQHPAANSGIWRKLENRIRRIAAEADATYIFTGPILANAEVEFIGEGRVAVPTHIYKVVLAIRDSEPTMYAAMIPNAAGLDFFTALDDHTERRLEARRPQHVDEALLRRATFRPAPSTVSWPAWASPAQ